MKKASRRHHGVAIPRTKNPIGLLCIAGIVSLSACGGSGGGGGSSGSSGSGGSPSSVTGSGFAPSSGPGDVSSYFPLTIGDQWTFNLENTSATAATESGLGAVSITGTQNVKGVLATILQRSDPTTVAVTDAYYYASNGGVTYLGDNDSTDLVTPQIVPYPQLLFPVAAGTQSTINATNLSDGKNSGGQPVTISFTQTIVNQALGQVVSTSIGTFSNALEQVTTVSGTATVGGQPATVSGTDTTWLVPNIGVVREVTTATVGATQSTEIFDLRSYQLVGGSPHGFGSQGALLGDIGPALGYVLRPAMATDGTNFLVVTAAGTPQQSLFGWIGQIVAPDGTVLATVNLNAPGVAPGSGDPLEAVAGFDGTNYLVVYEQDHTATLQPPSLVAAQISTQGQLLQTNTIVSSYTLGTPGPNYLALGYDGTNFLLVYFGLTQLTGQFISHTTAMATGAAFAIASGDDPANPAIAFDGTRYLVAWDETSLTGSFPEGVDFVFVPITGPISSATSVYASSSQNIQFGYPAVAFDGTNYLLTYLDWRANSNLDNTVSATRISSGGVLIDGSATSAGLRLSSTTGLSTSRSAVTYSQANQIYQVVWVASLPGGISQLTGATVLPTPPTGMAIASAGKDGFDIFRLSSSNGIAGLAVGANAVGSSLITWIPLGNPEPVDFLPVYPP
jgi:hypothetical protein